MTTIADASTIADGWRGWAFVAAACVIGAAVAVILTLVATPHNVPVMGDELSRLDRADRHDCAVTRCTYPGIVLRLTAADLGLESTWVCVGHSNEGDARKWWSS